MNQTALGIWLVVRVHWKQGFTHSKKCGTFLNVSQNPSLDLSHRNPKTHQWSLFGEPIRPQRCGAGMAFVKVYEDSPGELACRRVVALDARLKSWLAFFPVDTPNLDPLVIRNTSQHRIVQLALNRRLQNQRLAA